MKKQKSVIMGIVALIILLFGTFSGHIHLQFGNGTATLLSCKDNTQAPQVSTFNALAIQNITGELLIFPGEFDQFTQLLQTTKTQLQIQTYDFTEKRMKQLFKELLDANVNIQLIMENKKYQQFTDTFQDIQTTFSAYSNFAIKSDKQMKTEYVHSKIDLLDSGFLIKTANMTHSSFFANREYMLYSINAGVLASLKTIFDKDRAGEPITNNDIHPNLVICNINCRTVIETLLKEAKESIIIQTQYINDPALLNILSQQSKLPEMKLLVSDTDANDTLQGYLGAYTRRLSKPYLHAKMILIDHKILLLGSMNLSANSLDMNREIGILLLDPTLISEFSVQFMKDRKSGR